MFLDLIRAHFFKANPRLAGIAKRTDFELGGGGGGGACKA